MGEAFFPLDEELGLVSGGLTPRGEEMLVRLASWMPFEQARELLQDLVGIQVSKATARRATLSTGEAALAVDEAEVERLKQEVPQAPGGAGEGDKQAMSADGAFVHLVGGEWVEVKTLVIGEVTRTQRGEVCTQQVSSFSRLAEAALVETHRADAVRILDFAHAASAVSDIGEAVRAVGGGLSAKWLDGVLHRLSHPPIAAITAKTAESLAKQPMARPGTGYCWRKPVLRRLPSISVAPAEVCAKK